MKVDVVIAGAGPAGSIAALILSRHGKKVLVLEKDTFPRGKVCGDSLNPRCGVIWQRYGLETSFARLPHARTAGFVLERDGSPVLRHRFRGAATWSVDRAVLDAWLAEEAQASGATYRFGVSVQGLTATGVRTSGEEIAAPLVIGADGRNSVIGRLSGLARASAPCRRIGWQAFIERPTLDDCVHMNVFPGGYYGVSRIDAVRATLTMVLFAGHDLTPDHVLARYFPGAVATPWKSIHPISRQPWRVTDGRIWLVGDAARVLEPFTGEGISSAIATAEMAARQILAADRIGLETAARGYRRAHARFYGWRMLTNTAMRWALEDSRRSLRLLDTLRWCPAAIRRLVEAVQSPESPQLKVG
jgi:flavin-dependent dehydrogenase